MREYFTRIFFVRILVERHSRKKLTAGRRILRCEEALRWFDGLCVVQQVIYEESISVRYDGLADEDYVAGLVGLSVVHRSHDSTVNERSCPHSRAVSMHFTSSVEYAPFLFLYTITSTQWIHMCCQLNITSSMRSLSYRVKCSRGVFAITSLCSVCFECIVEESFKTFLDPDPDTNDF